MEEVIVGRCGSQGELRPSGADVRPTMGGCAVSMSALERCWGIRLPHRGSRMEGVSVPVEPATRDLQQVSITAGVALGVHGG